MFTRDDIVIADHRDARGLLAALNERTQQHGVFLTVLDRGDDAWHVAVYTRAISPAEAERVLCDGEEAIP